MRAAGVLHGGKSSTVFTMNGVQFHYDALGGQKTGAFLDQRENYAAAAGYARGHALDVCTYHGGFALHLARVCERVTALDISREALETAARKHPNMLVFLAPDTARLEELREAARHYLAWKSVARDQDSLNLDTVQRSQVDRPLLQYRKTKKIVTRSVQQLTIDSVIAWSE